MIRRWWAVLVVGLVVGAVMGPAPAYAHGGLAGSAPAQGAAVPAPVDAVSLTFTEKPSPFAYFTITGPAGTRVDNGWSNAEPAPLATPVREYNLVNDVWQPQEYTTGFPVKVAVAHWPAAGQYTVRYHSVASDGDQVKGDFQFVYTGAVTAAPAGWQAPTDQPKPELLAAAAEAPASTSAQAATPQQPEDSSIWVWLVPVLLIIAAVLCYLLVRPPAFLRKR
jgi:methionine-rich copper-binding protein CopC